MLFGLRNTETEETLLKDPDVQLLPRIVDKVILPKLNRKRQEFFFLNSVLKLCLTVILISVVMVLELVTLCWDPLSNSQTVSLVRLITRLIQEYPTLGHNSKSVTTLLKTIIDKMKEAVENDVFIPIYPKQ
jgi:GC-rich sequence DNA-binding factor